MKARLYHVQVNVGDPKTSLPFYRDFFTHLGYRIVSEGAEHLGATDGGATVWVIATPRARARSGFHRKNVGLNHLAFRVATRPAVDACVRDFLTPRGIVPLYDSPKEFPQYLHGYYAVFFEDPDRIKLEVVHIPT
jgi:catechol 2,3-dioxygenase-like lactoylglutathione lyase family enzyme